jgi:ABC-2 type transport system ATP-binding protein
MIHDVPKEMIIQSESDQQRKQVVVLDNLSKVYGDLQAVRELSLEIYKGEIFGLLGPNGAGKTTTLEMTVGLRVPTSGRISVLGADPQKDRKVLTSKIGVQPQEASLFPALKVGEILRLFGSFHAHSLTPESVLEQIGLTEKRKSLVKSLSGGQRQRLLIGLALIGDPQLLFLDEPTGALDPQSRRQLWDVIQEFRRQERTVVLTTHSMEEAEAICDRVAIVDAGAIIALGSPAELIRHYFPIKTISFDHDQASDEQHWYSYTGVKDVTVSSVHVEVKTDRSDETLKELLSHSDGYNFDIRSGNLEDVFLALTGRTIRD